MSETNTELSWFEQHKGDFIHTRAEVWWCEDPVCDCYQAQVTNTYRNRVTKTTFVYDSVWEGGFYSEQGSRSAENDLIKYRQELKQSDPELEARIKWQINVDYDRDLSKENMDE